MRNTEEVKSVGVELIRHSKVKWTTLVSSRGWFGSLQASPSGVWRVMRGLSGSSESGTS